MTPIWSSPVSAVFFFFFTPRACEALREYRDGVRLELQVLGSEKLQLVQHFIGHDSQFFSKDLRYGKMTNTSPSLVPLAWF